MDFFQDESVEEIAQAHIEEIRALEEKQAVKVLRAYKRVRSELQDRLSRIQTGTFTEQKMRGALVQVESAIAAMADNLLEEFDPGAQAAAEAGVKNLLKELRKWDKVFTGAVIPINLDAVAAATDTKNFLFNRYEVSMKGYSESLRARIAQGLTDAVIMQSSLGEVTDKIGRTFLGEEWKLQQIVRTELHNVYNIGKIDGMKSLWDEGEGTIPDLKKTLFHPMDNRTGKDSKRLSQNNPIVPINEPFVESSTGKKLTYMAPPNRPNDRAILIPFRDAWKK